MEREQFDNRMEQALDASERTWESAQKLFDQFEADIDDPFDPVLYGWVHFYRIKAAYKTESWQTVLDLIEAPRMPAHIGAKNSAWLYSVAAEAAARLGRIDDVTRCGQKCLDIRRSQDDRDGVRMAAQTVCALLDGCGALGVVREFAEELIDVSRAIGDDESAAYGYWILIRSLDDNPNPLVADQVDAARDWLRDHDSVARAAKALALLESSAVMQQRTASRDVAHELWEAAWAGDRAAVAALLDSGANPNVPWTHGRTALYAATIGGHESIVRDLLAAGANPKLRTTQGRAPLHAANEFGHDAVAAVLLAAGADPDARDMFGLTASELAEQT